MSAKERPILFSAPMVRALLAGRKTQTRRVVKGMALDWLRPNGFTREFVACPENGLCPYGQPGDRLWVRETWAPHDEITVKHRRAAECYYRADDDTLYCTDGRWRPSIHMPRWASRIDLEVTGVRVERLQDISSQDAWVEGIEHSPDVDPHHQFRDLWESINGDRSWDANPFVWVIEFKRIKP